MQGWQPKPIGSHLIPYGTPLHVRDLVLTLLRYQFANFDENEFPYKFVPDDYEKTHIAFDVAYNKESEVYGKKPMVIVERGPQSTSPVVVGDLSTLKPLNANTKNTTLVNSSVNAKVLSRLRMETEIIAQTIFGMFTSYRIYLPGILGIHGIPQIALSEIMNFEQDAQMYACTVDMQYQMQYRWVAETENPLLEGVQAYHDLLVAQKI